jgi:hypothetical protein
VSNDDLAFRFDEKIHRIEKRLADYPKTTELHELLSHFATQDQLYQEIDEHTNNIGAAL